MKGTKQMAARRKLISILPRQTIEELSEHDRPWALTLYELIGLAAECWKETEVRMAIERVFKRAGDAQETEQTTERAHRPSVRKHRAGPQHRLLSAGRHRAK